MSHADTVLRPMLRTVDEIVGEPELRRALDEGRPLRIKYGVDLTAPDLHIGHAVNLWLMRRLQDHGHRVVFLLGDLTTRIGDPTGKSETRPVLPPEAIEANSAAFLEQVSLVLDTDPRVFEVRRNSEWYERMPIAELLSLFSLTTSAQLMARDMFRERAAAGREIGMHELAYPVLQGYDSVAIESDLTIVGSDQLFNEMMGRQYQQRLGHRPQAVVTTVITPGLDGGPKQSKSLGNYVALLDPAEEKLGKVMSISDDLVGAWASAYSTLDDAEVAEVTDAAARGGRAARDAKLAVAESIAARYHGAAAAASAREGFLSTFAGREAPADVPELAVGGDIGVLELLALARPELSGAARRRLVEQGAVSLAERRVASLDEVVSPRDGDVLRTGRRSWTRLRRR